MSGGGGPAAAPGPASAGAGRAQPPRAVSGCPGPNRGRLAEPPGCGLQDRRAAQAPPGPCSASWCCPGGGGEAPPAPPQPARPRQAPPGSTRRRSRACPGAGLWLLWGRSPQRAALRGETEAAARGAGGPTARPAPPRPGPAQRPNGRRPAGARGPWSRRGRGARSLTCRGRGCAAGKTLGSPAGNRGLSGSPAR